MYFYLAMPKNSTTMDSRLEYRFGGGNGGVGGSMHSPSSHSPTKESLKNSERYVALYKFAYVSIFIHV